MSLGNASYKQFWFGERFAEGRLADFYLAKTARQEPVVIKRLLPQFAQRSDVLKPFSEAAHLAVHLNHPNIVKLFDFSEDHSETFMVLELVSGWDLEKIQQALLDNGHAMPIDLALFIIDEICSAIGYAHETSHLIHRGLTPNNVLVTVDGHVKIADFGLERAVRAAVSVRAGLLKGKFSYMSPEQCRGETSDARSDIFSIGTLLYELVCGRRLFRRSSEFATIQAVVEDPIPPPQEVRPEILQALVSVMMKALARDPDERFSTITQLQTELRHIQKAQKWNVSSEQVAHYVRELFPQGPLISSTFNVGSSPGFIDGKNPTQEISSSSATPQEPSRTEDSLQIKLTDPVSLSSAESVTPSRQNAASTSSSNRTSNNNNALDLDQAFETSFSEFKSSQFETSAPTPSSSTPLASSRSSKSALIIGSVIVGLLIIGSAVAVTLLRTPSSIEKTALRIETIPTGAIVFIDGKQRFGKTPLDIYDITDEAEHRLTVSAPGYRDTHQAIRLKPGTPNKITITLTPTESTLAKAHVVVHVEPGGAKIYFDGELYGDPPATISNVTANTPHHILVRKEGYQETVKPIVDLKPGETREVTITLEPEIAIDAALEKTKTPSSRR